MRPIVVPLLNHSSAGILVCRQTPEAQFGPNTQLESKSYLCGQLSRQREPIRTGLKEKGGEILLFPIYLPAIQPVGSRALRVRRGLGASFVVFVFVPFGIIAALVRFAATLIWPSPTTCCRMSQPAVAVEKDAPIRYIDRASQASPQMSNLNGWHQFGPASPEEVYQSLIGFLLIVCGATGETNKLLTRLPLEPHLALSFLLSNAS